MRWFDTRFRVGRADRPDNVEALTRIASELGQPCQAGSTFNALGDD